MELDRKLLSFRYKKTYILNQFKKKKLGLDENFIATKNHDTCPVCGCPEAHLISEVDRVGFPCDTVICKQCQFVFNNTYIANPSEFYSKEWGDERWGNPEVNFLKRTASDSYSWKRMAYLATKLGTDFKDISLVLEIGCGDGCNLYPYHLLGKKVTGCDFDERYLSPGKSRGMDLVTGDINSIQEGDKFDLILLIHSFEHVIDLNDMVNKVFKLLKPGGYVYVEVPGLLNWNRRKNKHLHDMGLSSSSNILGYLQFQHNYHFDLPHLNYFWRRNGFQLIEGDEWTRAIFKKADVVGKPESTVYDESLGCNSDVLNYLLAVEKDFLTLSYLVCAVIRTFIQKKCNLD